MKVHKLEQPNEDCPSHSFWCPACGCAHAVWTTGRVKWTFNGDLDKATFEPSLMISGGGSFNEDGVWRLKPACHVVVTNGILNYQLDSGHKLAGQSIPMEDF
jgi:hypothetical protein